MDIKLRGKRAIITGSTGGMGYAMAKGLAEAGAAVVLNGRTEARVVAAIERLKQEVPEAEVSGVAADVGDVKAINQLIAAVPQADILVNNAGPIEEKPFFEITDEEWERFFQVYVMAAVRLSCHYAQEMVKQDWGRVLFNASVTGGFNSGEMVHYGTTKTALLGLSRGLAESVASSGVTVNAFIPGPTHTEEDFNSRYSQIFGKTFKQLEQEFFPSSTSLLKRFITPTEVANFVVFLASDQASAITGATLRVDGGIIRSIL
ncbi:MAG: SDR family oxidoreductase [Chloroflexi bacterium]|nr:SDR family oxidoreductase [Chloroflexota bacterium]